MSKHFSNKSSKGEKKFFKKKSEETQHKRKMEEDHNTSSDVDAAEQINILLQEFRGNMQKKLQSKQKKLKQDIEESVETASDEMLNIFNKNVEGHQLLVEEFRAKLVEFIEQQNSNMLKEQEVMNQLQKAMKQRDKEITQLLAKKKERLVALKTGSDIFFQGLEDLMQNQKLQYNETYNEVQENVKHIHKKIQANNQEEAMVKLRKNLQSILD